MQVIFDIFTVAVTESNKALQPFEENWFHVSKQLFTSFFNWSNDAISISCPKNLTFFFFILSLKTLSTHRWNVAGAFARPCARFTYLNKPNSHPKEVRWLDSGSVNI